MIAFIKKRSWFFSSWAGLSLDSAKIEAGLLLKSMLVSSLVSLSGIRSLPSGELPEDFSSLPTEILRLNGQDLAVKLFLLKNSPDDGDRERYRKVQEFFKDLTGEEFDAVTVPSKKQVSTLSYYPVKLEVEENSIAMPRNAPFTSIGSMFKPEEITINVPQIRVKVNEMRLQVISKRSYWLPQ